MAQMVVDDESFMIPPSSAQALAFTPVAQEDFQWQENLLPQSHLSC